MPNILTEAQVQSFYREGYLIVNNVYGKDEIDQIRDIFVGAFERELWQKSVYDSIDIINDIFLYFPSILNTIFSTKYIIVLQDVLGKNLICLPEFAVHHNRYTDWHRDTTRMEQLGDSYHHNAGKVIIQSAIYFQDNMPFGGGLTVVPKSHLKHDRFTKMYYGNVMHRAFFKMAKLVNASPFDVIEKEEQPVNILSKIGDLVLFNNQSDHRATFIRDKNGKAIPAPIEKFAIFNAFTNDMELGRRYQDSLKKADEPYARFLKQHLISAAFEKRAKELGFRWYY